MVHFDGLTRIDKMIRIDERRSSRVPLAIAALAAAVAVCAWAFWEPQRPLQKQAGEPTLVQSAGNTSKADAIAGNAPSSPASNPKAGAGESQLAAMMRATADLRTFYVEALKNPKAGGVTYASYAADLCRVAKNAIPFTGNDWDLGDLPYAAPEDPKAYSLRNDAYHKVKAACQSFSTAELGFQNGEELLARARAQGDSLRQLVDQALASKASDPASRKNALAAVLDNGDPLLISETLERLLMSSSNGRLAYWIDGAQTNIGEADVFRSALQALPCRLGLLCDGRDPDVVQSCIGLGKCYPDRIAMIENALPDAKRAEFQQRLDKLETAVKSKQAGQLIP